MKRETILLGAAWVATVVVAYFVGTGIGESTGKSAAAGNAASPAGNSTPAGGSAAPGGSREQRAFLRRADELDDSGTPTPGGKQNIQLLIARARQQFGIGMGGMMNIRGMFRAIAPLVELDDAQLHDALAEVEKTVTEPQAKMMFYSVLLGQWAETDGKAALAYADEKLGDGSPFNFGVRASILGAWARRDPDSVWRWYQTERKDDGNEQSKNMLISMMFSGMASSDLDGALQRMSSLDDASRGMALSGIAQSAADDVSRKRLLDRAGGLPEVQRNQIRSTIAGQWAMMDPDAATKWINSLPAGEQKVVRDSAGNMMLFSRPERAGELLLQGAEEKDKPAIYDRVVQQWGYQNPKAAGEWLTKQPQGPELDNARRTYAVMIAQRDPAAAMDWAKSVQSEESRVNSVEQIYQQWKARDANAATAALETSGLSSDHVERIKKGQPNVQATATRNP